MTKRFEIGDAVRVIAGPRDGGGYPAPGELLTKDLYVEMWKRCGRIPR